MPKANTTTRKCFSSFHREVVGTAPRTISSTTMAVEKAPKATHTSTVTGDQLCGGVRNAFGKNHTTKATSHIRANANASLRRSLRWRNPVGNDTCVLT